MGNKARSSPLIFQDNDPVTLGGDETSTIQNDGTDLLITETTGQIKLQDVDGGPYTLDQLYIAAGDYVLTDGSSPIVGDQEIEGTLTVTGSGAGKRTVQIGEGEGAVKIHHDNVGGETSILFTPYNGGDWDSDHEFKFDAATDQWTLGGNPIVAPSYYYPDYTRSDHSKVHTQNTIAYLCDQIGTSDIATLYLRHNSGGSTTAYHFKDDLDLTVYGNITFYFEPGAILAADAGTEVVTFYRATQLSFQERQGIGSPDMFAFAVNIMRYSCVDLFPWIGFWESNLRLPSGLWVDVSASTTNGIQEAFDAASSNGYNLQICGGQEDTGGSVVFSCTTTINVPAVRGMVVKTGSILIDSSAAPVIQFDTFTRGYYDFNCEFVGHDGSAPVVLIKPESSAPAQSNAAFGDTRMHITGVVNVDPTVSGADNALICIDGSGSGYLGPMRLTVEEIDGANAANVVGFSIINIQDGKWAFNSTYNLHHIHACQVGIQVGDASGYNDFLVNNTFNISTYSYDPSDPTEIGVDCYASHNTFNMGSFFDYSNGYTIQHGTDVRWRSTAKKNILVSPVVSNIIDDSDGSNRIITSVSDSFLDPFADNYYEVDSGAADQGAINGAEMTVKYIVDTLIASTTKHAVVHFSHNPESGDTTTYTWDTTDTFATYPYLYFKIDPGAILTRTTGDETVTLYSAGNMSADPGQKITAVDMLRFEKAGTVWSNWWGALPSAADSGVPVQYAVNSVGVSYPSKVTIVPGEYTATTSVNIEFCPDSVFDFEGVKWINGSTDVFTINKNHTSTPNHCHYKFGAIHHGGSGLSAIRSYGQFHSAYISWQAIYGTSRQGFGLYLDADSGDGGAAQSVVTLDVGYIEKEMYAIYLSSNTNIDTVTANTKTGFLVDNDIGLYVRTHPGGIQTNTCVWNLNIDASVSAGDISVKTNEMYSRFNLILGDIGTTNILLGSYEGYSASNNDLTNCRPTHLAYGSTYLTDSSGNNTNTYPRYDAAPITITPGASPWTYQNTLHQDMMIALSSGTVSSVQLSSDNITFYTYLTTSDVMLHLPKQMYMKVTYSSAPTVKGYLY